MSELDDKTILEWMTSSAFRDFLESQSTHRVISLAISAIADADLVSPGAAMTDAYAVWSRAVNALCHPHRSPVPVQALYADAAAAALALSAMARIADDQEEFELDRSSLRGSLGLNGMPIVNTPTKLAEFMANPWARLARELAEAHAPLTAIQAVLADRASRLYHPEEGRWWAWADLSQPAARAAADTAAAAWHLAESPIGQLHPQRL
jgi:hypothetical protein